MKKNILDFVNINMTYEDGYVAIDNFNLQINRGEFVTLLGPSGCGKTTMLKIIGGFIYPTRGKILYNGIDIKNVDITKRPTSTVFQDYALFPNMTVRQNIEYGLKLMRVKNEKETSEFANQLQKIIKSSQKKADYKINEISKIRKGLTKDIERLKKRYKKNIFLEQISTMNRAEFIATIDLLYQKLEKEYGKDYESKIKWKAKFLDAINSTFSLFHIPYQFQISSKNMNEIEKEIYLLKKWYRFKKPIDDKLELLNNKNDDFDYDISYWQNYPNEKKEQFEKRYLTRKLNKEEIAERANKVIELVGLKGWENSYPEDLSGGMKQRVALARSIVIEPEILLLDEPLGALDAKVRKQLQNEIKRLHKELGLTFILVTHDQEEALMLSDKIVVMSQGKIEQVGTPNAIYDTPVNSWVAQFIGRTNLLDVLAKNRNEFIFNNKTYNFPSSLKLKIKAKDKLLLVIRPEDLKISNNTKPFITGAKIVDIIYKGLLYEIKCEWNNQTLIVENTTNYEIGATVNLDVDFNDLHFIKKENEGEN